MTVLEQKIIDVTNSIPMTYGQYRLINPLYIGIARVMGYKVTAMSRGYTVISNVEEHEKVRKIIAGMVNKGIIVKSKSGQAFKIVRR